MVKVFDIISRVAHDGAVKGTISREVEWELEELKGSTNRLKVEVPLEDSMDVATDEELLFRKRRYIITELSRHKNSRITEIIADEAQTELSSRRVRRLQLNKATLGDALEKALSNTAWTVGTVFEPQVEFNAEIENQTVSYCLDFLVNQSGGRIKFDSVNKTVSILDNTEQEPVTTFHYKRNLDDISKTEVQPKATVLYPYGKEGMNIESLNDGNDYIEDFSWYTGLGMSLSEARERFRKEMVWEDNRYVYVGNLLREAQKRLASLSHPQINYAIKTASLQNMNLHIDDSVYVVDEELGIKIKTIVSRVITSNDPTRNEVELDYVPSSLSDIVADNTSGDSVGGDAEAVFVSKNAGREIISDIPTPVLSTSIPVIASTFFHVSLAVQLNVTTAGTIRGYFTMDGDQIPTTIRLTATEGWYTIGLPFIITQVQEGAKNLDFYLYIEGGSGEVEAEGIELYVTSKGALGGTRNERPDQRVSDHIDIPVLESLNVIDIADVHQERPVSPKVSELIQLPLTVIDMSDNVSIELNGPITDPSTIPDGELDPVERNSFGDMGKYEAYMAPSQEQVDKFIADNDANRVFKIISIGEQVFVFTTATGSITLDYINRKVSSAFPMDILTPSGELIDEVLELDWLANVGVIIEHELYLHSPDMSGYSKYLASVPVPPDRTYDNLFIFGTDKGEKHLFYTNGNIIVDHPEYTNWLGDSIHSYQYKWDGDLEDWAFERSSSGTRLIRDTITEIIFSATVVYSVDTSTVIHEADDLSLIAWRHLTDIPEFPTEWQGLPWVVVKAPSGDMLRLYIAKGIFFTSSPSGHDFGVGDVLGWYSYKWSGTDWVYRSDNPSSALAGNGFTTVYTSSDISNYNTGELVYPAGYTDTSTLLNK